MKYKKVNDWEIDGDTVILKVNEKEVDILDIDGLVTDWLEKQKDKEFEPVKSDEL